MWTNCLKNKTRNSRCTGSVQCHEANVAKKYSTHADKSKVNCKVIVRSKTCDTFWHYREIGRERE